MYNKTILLIGLLAITFTGCSSHDSPTTPDLSLNPGTFITQDNRYLLGYWDVTVNSDDSIEVIPRRNVSMHLNAIRLLEVDPCLNCVIFWDLTYDSGNFLCINVTIKNPYYGIPELTAFDVRGIFISFGDTYFPEEDCLVSLDDTHPRLLNHDGYTRLYNAIEYPTGSGEWAGYEYFPGKISKGINFTSTLNPYLAYCRSNSRRMTVEFGEPKYREVRIKFPSKPFQFGYAVDASWVPVDEVTNPITDFPPEANCLEPYWIRYTQSNVLNASAGSSTNLDLMVYDHQGLDTIGDVTMECPGIFEGTVHFEYTGVSDDDAHGYTAGLTLDHDVSPGIYPMLIKAESLDSDPVFGDVAAYNIVNLIVSADDPGGGELQWVTVLPMAGASEGNGGLAALSDGSFIVTGYFPWGNSVTTFDEGGPNETTLTQDDGETFIARYAADGSLVWAKNTGYGLHTRPGALISLQDDSFILSGTYRGDTIFGLGESAETTLPGWKGSGHNDIFIAAYNPNGTLKWAKWIGGSWELWNQCVTSGPSGRIYVSGSIKGEVVFGMGENNELIIDVGEEYRGFVASYNPDGSFAWVRYPGGEGSSSRPAANAIYDAGVAVIGRFSGEAIFGEGGPNETILNSYNGSTYLAYYKNDGKLILAKSVSFCDASDSAVLSNGTLITTGHFTANRIFGAGDPGEVTLNTHGGSDIFVMKHGPLGSMQWAFNIGSIGYDYGSVITSLNSDGFVTSGIYSGDITFGEGELFETSFHWDDIYDLYIARYTEDGVLSWANRVDASRFIHVTDITNLVDDSTIIIGNFDETAVFGEGEPNETTLDVSYHSTMYIAAYAP